MRRKTLIFRTAFLLPGACVPLLCLAQENVSDPTSLSGGIPGSDVSDALSASGDTSGLTSSVTITAVRADVNDPTHSQLLGSSLSPLDNAAVFAAPETAPQTGILSDAQTSAGLGAFGFVNHRNLSFAPGAAAHALPSAAVRPPTDSFGALAAEASFAGGAAANAAFSGRASRGAAAAGGFSGEGAAPAPAATAPAILAPSAFPLPHMQQAAAPPAAPIGMASAAPSILTDPALTNSSAGYDTGPEIHGDLPSASVLAAGFFAEYHTPHPLFQYDDGQTPAPGIPEAGGILGGSPFYTHASSGFPDSTRGSAAADDPFPLGSPFSSAPVSEAGPFPAVSEGSFFEPKTGLHPDLHVKLPPPAGSFEAYEARLRRTRLSHGASISQAEEAYQQDLKDFHRSHGRVGRKPSLTPETQSTAGLQLEMQKAQSIR